MTGAEAGSLRPPLLKRLTEKHWIAIDCVSVTVLMLSSRFMWTDVSGPVGKSPADVALTLLAVLPAGLRRRRPLPALAVVTILGAVATARTTSAGPALAIAFVMYLVPLRFPRREALRLLAGTLAVVLAGIYALVLTGRPDGEQWSPAPVVLGDLLAITAAWVIGYLVRQQRAYSAGLLEQEELRAHEQVAEARRAINEERLQIARELHDVVAHSMSVIAVQAGVANFVVAERPEEAPRALASIEETSRSALREMRALLGVLRADPGLAPAPGLADLPALADRTAEAGVRVKLSVVGDQSALPAGVDLAAYRVVQEAVTNVIKHAGTDACRVTIAYAGNALALEIIDAGKGTADADKTPGHGHGLAGMRERVGMYGGTLDAGPLPVRGFRVTARFPLAGPE